jgi:hypothetical protein
MMALALDTMAISPKSPEPPKNPIATSVEKSQSAAADKSSPGGLPQSSISNALGNLFLLVILASLISIPFLVYFTDTGSRAKKEFRKLVRPPAANGASAALSAAELEGARRRVSELEKQVELLQAREAAAKAAAAQSAPAPATPPQPATAPPASPAPDLEPVPETLPRREYDVTKLFNGVGVRTVLDLTEGGTATKDRVTPDSYELQVTLKVAVPKANSSVAELSALNPSLPSILPGLEKLLATSKVSPFFDKLYSLKHERIKSSVTRLEQLETRHNYFDCETILDLTHPESGQKAVLVQGEMDVVADGSDGDRMPTIDDYISLSRYYQPTTSYGWAKKTKAENPLLPRLKKELDEVEAEYAIKGLTPDRNRYLNERRTELKRLISDLASRSYLIAEADPFIVLPLSVVRHEGSLSHRPSIGDYAVVIHGDKIYPAICGDSGPSWKMGEASLLLARTIDESAGPYQRPVSDLKVTYLIFPGSGPAVNDAPDLTQITAKCQTLLNGVGGLGEGFSLHPWRDIIAERRAVRESAGLIAGAKSLVSAVAAKESAARKAVTTAQAAQTEAKAALDKVTAATPAPEPTALDPLKATLDAKSTALEKAKSAAESASAGKRKAEELAALIAKNAEAIRAASNAAYPKPRAETTDVALAKLTESRKALEEIAKLK